MVETMFVKIDITLYDMILHVGLLFEKDRVGPSVPGRLREDRGECLQPLVREAPRSWKKLKTHIL